MPLNDKSCTESILSCWSDETAVHEAPTQSTDHNPSSTRSCFVVKRLYRRQSESHRQFIKRASSEYCIASVLSHINVVGALNLLMEDYNFCMVMNLVEMGDPLSVIINSNHMTMVNIINYFKQLVQAIDYIQNIGIAHRNIRLENILIFSDGCLKLTGFGDAFVFRSPLQNHHLKSQGRVGTVAYQPPETLLWWGHYISLSSSSPPSYLCVTKKDQHQQNHLVLENDQGCHANSVDIWSMGVVLLHMLQRYCPWSVPCQYHDADYAHFVAHYQQKTFPIILSLPSPFQCLIYRMLDPNPLSRIDIQQLVTNL